MQVENAFEDAGMTFERERERERERPFDSGLAPWFS